MTHFLIYSESIFWYPLDSLAGAPGLRPTTGKVFHPCTLPEQQDHTTSHRYPEHPPCRLRIWRFPSAGYTSSRFCGAGVHFFKHSADGFPAYRSLQFHTGFFFQQFQCPSGMAIRDGATGNLYRFCFWVSIRLAQSRR